jgi:phenylacetate-CoA ligase
MWAVNKYLVRKRYKMSTATYENILFNDIEKLPRDEIKQLQSSKLKETVKQVQSIPFYKKKFEESGITPNSIKSLDDIRRLPFTTKEDLRQNYPFNMLAVPKSEIMRVHGSSGTTGKPTLVAYTKNDLQTWANLCSRFLVAGGLRKNHMVQLSFGLGLFTGGFGLHYGIENIGASVVPAAGGNTPRQIMFMQDLEPDALVCTPSYALNIAEHAINNGIDPRKFSLKYGYFGGEMWTDELRKKIEDAYDIMAFNNYGLSEVIGPGVSGECYKRDGMHVQEDCFIVECLNPETLEPVKEGEVGELVFTSLCKEASPIIRYRTRDLSSLSYEQCECGRTGAKMSRVTGRSDDMLIIRGVNIFPSQIEEALLKVEGAAPQYQIEISRPNTMDEVTVKVEITPEVFSDQMSKLHNLRDQIDRAIHAIIGIRVNVELVEPQTLERSSGKATRVIDNRNITKK